jgi:hypothetical protein
MVDRARLWALVRMAGLDANMAIAQVKMRYMTWRPLNAIRNADRDPNSETTRDPLWGPAMPTPNHSRISMRTLWLLRRLCRRACA